MIVPDEHLRQLRDKHQALERRIGRDVRVDQSRSASWKRDEEKRLRTEAHHAASTSAFDVLSELREQRAAMREVLPPPHPDGHPDAVDEIVNRLQQHRAARGVQFADLTELPNTALESHVARAREGSEDDVLTAARVLSVLQRRAELGDTGAARTAMTVGVRLPQLVWKLEATEKRVAEYERLGTLAQNINSTLNAISTGAADDGVRYDKQAQAAADRAAAQARGERGQLVVQDGAVKWVPETAA